MESYLTLVIVTLPEVTIERKDQHDSPDNPQQQERKIMAAMIPPATGVHRPGIVMLNAQFKSTATFVGKTWISKPVVYKKRTQKMIIKYRGHINQMPGNPNPRAFFNILRSLPRGEPTLIQ
jgi:hypothetical protein